MGESKLKPAKREKTLLSCAGVQTMAGGVQVRWESPSPATPKGQLGYFIEFLNLTGLWSHWVQGRSLKHGSLKALSKADVLGTWMLSILEPVTAAPRTSPRCAVICYPTEYGSTVTVSDRRGARPVRSRYHSRSPVAKLNRYFDVQARGAVVCSQADRLPPVAATVRSRSFLMLVAAASQKPRLRPGGRPLPGRGTVRLGARHHASTTADSSAMPWDLSSAAASSTKCGTRAATTGVISRPRAKLFGSTPITTVSAGESPENSRQARTSDIPSWCCDSLDRKNTGTCSPARRTIVPAAWPKQIASKTISRSAPAISSSSSMPLVPPSIASVPSGSL